MSGQAHLFERIQQELKRSLNGYVDGAELEQGLAQYIVPPGLGRDGGSAGRAGARGATPRAADALMKFLSTVAEVRYRGVR